jgi:hypothetical protein
MWRKVLILLGLIIIVTDCSGQNKPKQQTKSIINKSLVVGIWTNGQTENATFEIEKDSIYYVDSFQKFKYIIVGDSITIKFDGFDNVSKIEKVTRDSLILKQGNDRMIFWKFKG